MKKKLDLGKSITDLANTFDEELYKKSREELESYWHFTYKPKDSVVLNIYNFHKLLGSYGNFCRRWEEHHNGTCCVVERVRDQYLMPKIEQFAQDLEWYNFLL